jgi:hypothetical protein
VADREHKFTLGKSLSLQRAERLAEKLDTPATQPLQRDPLEQVTCGAGYKSCASAHASLLSRSNASQPGPAGQLLLQLQRQYGNRYVERVLDLAKGGGREAEVAPDVERVIQRERGGGQAIDGSVRRRMEGALGADFSGVRVHTGVHADTLSRALNARAFTTGKDIFFRQGAYTPGSSGGRELLAHELTHVVQQSGEGVRRKLTLSQPGERHELEADQVAQAVIQQEQEAAHQRTDRWPIARQHEEEEEKMAAQAKAGESAMQRQSAPTPDAERRIDRQRPRPAQEITFGEEEGAIIRAAGARSATIDSFYNHFPDKLLLVLNAFDHGMAGFSDSMRFPPDSNAEVDFQNVFLSQLGEVVKAGYSKYLEPALSAEFPGIGTAVSLVTAMHAEVQRAKEVSGQLALRDFMVGTRTAFGDALRRRIDAFITATRTALPAAQSAWRATETPAEEEALLAPMRRLLDRPTPTASDFQRRIVSAYIRSQQGQVESGFLEIRSLGRVTVKYDDDGSFESATVQLRTGSGSGQVADQINRLYRSPIDLRLLGVAVSIGVYGPGIAGGRTYYYVNLTPPDYRPSSRDLGYERYTALSGDPLRVPRVSG